MFYFARKWLGLMEFWEPIFMEGVTLYITDPNQQKHSLLACAIYNHNKLFCPITAAASLFCHKFAKSKLAHTVCEGAARRA